MKKSSFVRRGEGGGVSTSKSLPIGCRVNAKNVHQLQLSLGHDAWDALSGGCD